MGRTGQADTALTGGCFCGLVAYEVTEPLRNGRACHCSRCRKAFSGASSAYAEVVPGAFRWTTDQQHVSVYQVDGTWGLAFCSRCGSTLAGLTGGTVHGITLGTVDGIPAWRSHSTSSSIPEPPGTTSGGDAPRYAEYPPAWKPGS